MQQTTLAKLNNLKQTYHDKLYPSRSNPLYRSPDGIYVAMLNNGQVISNSNLSELAHRLKFA